MDNPTPEQVQSARNNAGLTQKKAAELIHSSRNSWVQWESGIRKMHPAFFELFIIKSKNFSQR